ncbi:MAG: choice-of-anchor tandem repeat GloVer-containing protein [Bryobacteraceae bacterium]
MHILRLGCWLALAVTAAAQAQTNETVLRSFNSAPHGAAPCAGVSRDSSGNLYGTTQWGGNENAGTVYKLDTAGNLGVLYSFKGGTDGKNPCSGVTLDADGNLFGVTGYGGADNYGVVYKLAPNDQETILHTFTGGDDGGLPTGVVLDSSGNLYGSTLGGGAAHKGVVFKIDRAGHEKVLYTFKGGADGGGPSVVSLDAAENLYGTTGGGYTRIVFKISPAGQESVLYTFGGGCDPTGGVTLDSSGNLYGVTKRCGADGQGVLYKLTPSGTETVLYSFNGKSGIHPGGVVLDAAGNIYGMTQDGGPGKGGAVYELNTDGNFSGLYVFASTASADGEHPNAGLALDSAGNIYGTTTAGGIANQGVIFEVSATGQESVLYGFPGAPGGSYPDAGVTLDSAGNLYGTTYNGGTTGSGVVYKLDPAGNETVLYSFPGGAGGANPYAGVTLDARGNIYGTTLSGGASNMGAAYKLDLTGNATVLHSFGGPGDGSLPYAGATLDAAGNIYGTTFRGGTFGNGAIFELDPAGNETILHSFNCYPDGCWPYGGVTLDAAGNLHGTTFTGGLENGNNGGTVWEFSATGVFSVLYSFTGATDGGAPSAGVILDGAGNLYGTTQNGGTANLGVVFKLTPAGQETVLYSFPGGASGWRPHGGVVISSDGDLFGTTYAGGAANAGVVFEVSSSGQETVLYSFMCAADGCNPNSGVVSDQAGNLYGTTSAGGAYGADINGGGVVFKIEP